MSLYSFKTGSGLNDLALARHRQSTHDFKSGYIAAMRDSKEFSNMDQLFLAKALFKRDRVRNTWENLPEGVQAKYLSDASTIAASLGFTQDEHVGNPS